MYTNLYTPMPGNHHARGYRKALNIRSFLVLALLMCFAQMANAQAPTSLRYPTPNVYIANVSSVYLAPTVAGNVTGYRITPALPAGLSFNTNTGVVNGTPTVASAAANYTIWARGGTPLDSTSTVVNLTVTNNFFNNAFDTVYFGGTGVTITNKVGDGTNVGDIVLYQNVARLSGQNIDCIIKTRTFTAGTTFSAYDQPLETDGSTFNSNKARFFAPQVTFPNGGGSLTFDFQFILGGSYNNTNNTGLPVVLQNVKINTYDIDGNGQTNSNQYNDFGGFDSSAISSSTTLQAPVYNATTGLTRYRSNTSANNLTVTADATRVRVSYTNISDFTIVAGAGAAGAAYFFLDFSSGPAFSTAVTTPAPTIDLNTSTTGVNNAATGCGTQLAFTAASQTNVASATALNQLDVNFSNASSNIRDAASERLVISGGTPAASDTIAFNAAAGTSTVTLGGVTYLITRTVSGTTSNFAFTNNAGGTFTLANAETLLDALRYYNVAAAPTAGDRNFTVTVRNTQFTSPDAIFTASLNCVSISGNIFHDVNGLTNDSVNASGTQFTANQLYAVRVNPADNKVIDTRGIAAGGAYNFGTSTPGTYILYLNTTAPAAGTTFTTPTYPAGTSATYKSIGENLGAGAGNDRLIDGKLIVTVGSISVTNANFGIEIPPVTANTSFSGLANPGGFNGYSLTGSNFNATDEDGTVSSITITEFPTGANYLKVGATVYTNGGSCPPQSVCTAWPGTVTVPFANLNTISVDPTLEGTTSVVITYYATDNGALNSNTSTVTLNFVATNYYSVSGNVWNDANGNGQVNGVAEELVAPANTGQTLYALLVQNTNTYSTLPTVLMSAVVNTTTGYSFSNVPGGNNYEVRIVARAAMPVAGSAASLVTPALATGWTGVSTNINGTITSGRNTNNLVDSLNNLNGNRTNVNFGIEQIPVADSKAFVADAKNFSKSTSITIGGNPTFYINSSDNALTGSTLKSLSGTDVEDCEGASSCNTGKTFQIMSVKANTRLYYDFGAGNGGVKEVTASSNSKITSFDLTKLVIYGQRGTANTDATALGFTYSLIDNAGVPSVPVTYALKSSTTPLPVVLADFTGNVVNCAAVLNWKTASEVNSSYYEVQQSKDGIRFAAVATVKSKNNETGADYSYTVNNLSAGTYFRLKIADMNAESAYSQVLALNAANCGYANISVWPNPVNDAAKISGLAGTENTIMIFDYMGRQVYKMTTTQSAAEVNMSNYAPGTYMVQVTDSNGGIVHAARIVKN